MTPLNALKTHLAWQLSDLEQQSQRIINDIETLDSQSQQYQTKIAKASYKPAMVLPELEISREYFIINQYQTLEHLAIQKKTLIKEQDALISQIRHLKTKVRLLEKHTDKKAKQAYQYAQQMIEKNMDEWVLQQGRAL